MSFTLNLLMINCSHPRGQTQPGASVGLAWGRSGRGSMRLQRESASRDQKRRRNAPTWVTHTGCFFYICNFWFAGFCFSCATTANASDLADGKDNLNETQLEEIHTAKESAGPETVLYVLKLLITSALNHRSAGSQIGRVCRRLPPLEPSAAQTEAAKKWEDAGGLFWCSTQKG